MASEETKLPIYGPLLPTIDIDATRVQGDALAGSGTVVFTGVFHDPHVPCFAVCDNPLREGREHVAGLVERAGGRVATSISKVRGRTRCLVAGHSPGARLLRLAKEMGVPVIDTKGLAHVLTGTKGPPPDAQLHGVKYSMGFQPRAVTLCGRGASPRSLAVLG